MEHLLAKEGVAGSIPVSRFFDAKNQVFDDLVFLRQTSADGRSKIRSLASGSVVASLLRKEVSTGHLQRLALLNTK